MGLSRLTEKSKQDGTLRWGMRLLLRRQRAKSILALETAIVHPDLLAIKKIQASKAHLELQAPIESTQSLKSYQSQLYFEIQFLSSVLCSAFSLTPLALAGRTQLKSARHPQFLLQNCVRNANPRPRSRKQTHRRRGERRNQNDCAAAGIYS